jgi:hypothetical protein
MVLVANTLTARSHRPGGFREECPPVARNNYGLEYVH